MSQYSSPLRYPGGKGKVTDFLKSVIEENDLLDGHYIEPFAGGASVALNLLFDEYVKKISINDIDKSIYSFWHSVLYDTDRLCNLILDTNVNIDEWRKQKDIQKNKNRYSLLNLGFSTFFLNRTNRSGIIKAGAIGGIKQEGSWKIDARFNKEELIVRINKIAKYSGRINLYNLDTIDLLKSFKRKKLDNAIFYFDPPYYVKGKDLYTNFYKHDDHVLISNEISKLKAKWIVSYDNVPHVQNIYKAYRQVNYDLNYSAFEHRVGSEIMIFSNDLVIPEDNLLFSENPKIMI